MVEWAHPDSKCIVHVDYILPRQVQERLDSAETIPSAGLVFLNYGFHLIKMSHSGCNTLPTNLFSAF